MMVVNRFTKGMAMVFAVMLSLASAFAGSIEGKDAPTDVEIWNKGIGLYVAGSNDLALATLRPLALSRTHGARASEVVGKILFDKANAIQSEDPVEAAKLREEALLDFQRAAKSNPDDARVQRNYTRAASGIVELRRNAHVTEVLKKSAQGDPSQLIASSAAAALRIQKEQLTVFTNAPEVALAKSEALAKETETLADAWISVRQAIMQSVTNEQQAANIIGDIESSMDATLLAAERLADMAPEAAESLQHAEAAFHRFHKLTAMPPDANDQAILAQTNAYADISTENGRDWQQESLEWTRAFRAKFPMWAQAYEQQAQSDTNKPPFTKEQQAEISALSTEVEKLQIECTKALLPPKQLEALEKLLRIRELLPKDGKGGGQNQQNKNQSDDQNKNDSKRNDQSNENGQNGQNDQNNQNDQNDQDQEKNEERNETEAKDGDSKDDQAVEDILRKAQERSDEHEQDKKARARKVPLPANERDW